MPIFKVGNINYCIEDEDIQNILKNENSDAPVDEMGNIHFDQEIIDNKIREIEENLPSELMIELETLDGDIEDLLSDAISDRTGWLIYSFNYELV